MTVLLTDEGLPVFRTGTTTNGLDVNGLPAFGLPAVGGGFFARPYYEMIGHPNV